MMCDIMCHPRRHVFRATGRRTRAPTPRVAGGARRALKTRAPGGGLPSPGGELWRWGSMVLRSPEADGGAPRSTLKLATETLTKKPAHETHERASRGRGVTWREEVCHLTLQGGRMGGWPRQAWEAPNGGDSHRRRPCACAGGLGDTARLSLPSPALARRVLALHGAARPNHLNGICGGGGDARRGSGAEGLAHALLILGV